MATIYTYETECTVCGKASQQSGVGTIDPTGYPDLDTRPGGEEGRGALPFRIQRCPHCGYCAPRIDLEYPQAEKSIRLPAYQAGLRRRSLPETARAYLAWALLQELDGEHNGAAWSALHAAWCADDEAREAAAHTCRSQALAAFERARRPDGSLVGFVEPGAQELFLADLYRRLGQFEAAETVCRSGLKKRITAILARSLEFEALLIDRKDRAAHSLEEVVEGE
jgi:hypothetical protein